MRRSGGAHRFRIQRRVEIKARDRGNHKFLFGIMWRTVATADKRATAETNLSNMKHDEPKRVFRMVEEWPPGTNERVIL